MLSLDKQDYWREQYRFSEPGWQPATEHFAALVGSRLVPGARILDLGCGRGGLVEQIGTEGYRLVGADPDYLSLQSHRVADFPRATAVSNSLPFVSRSFDMVIASWVLEHLDSPMLTFREIARVLRPMGSFVFITPNIRHPLSIANRLFGGLGTWQQKLVNGLYGRSEVDTYPTRYQVNSETTICQLGAATGLTCQQVIMVADPTYLSFNQALYDLSCALEKRLPANRHIHLVGELVKNPE